MGGTEGYFLEVEKPFHSTKRVGEFLKRREFIASNNK